MTSWYPTVPADFPSDGCTLAPDRLFGYDFTDACRLHDYMRRSGLYSVKDADRLFHRYLKEVVGAPRWLARLYWFAVKITRPFYK